MTTAVKTFGDICEFVTRSGNIGESFAALDTLTQNKIKDFINITYDQVAYKKIWPWRKQNRWIKTTPKITATNVSVNPATRIVTFQPGVVTDSFKGQFFQVNGDEEYYEIVSRTGTNTVALSCEYAGTLSGAATATIWRVKYGLWPDYSDLGEVVPLSSGSILWDRKLRTPSSQEFLSVFSAQPTLRTASTFSQLACVIGKEVYRGPAMGPEFIMGYDFMNDCAMDDAALWIYPPTDNVSVYVVFYGTKVEPLSNLTDEPIMDRDKRLVLAYGAIEHWFRTQLRDHATADRYERKKEQELAAMVADFDKSESVMQLQPVTRRRQNGFNHYIQRYKPWLIR